MVSLPFPHQSASEDLEALGCTCLHAPGRTSRAISTLAARRNSAPIFEYSFIRSRHLRQLLMCSAACGGIRSPSQSEERNSCNSAHFILPPSAISRRSRSSAVLPSRRTVAISPFPPVSPESLRVPHTTVLRLHEAIKPSAGQDPGARGRRPVSKAFRHTEP